MPNLRPTAAQGVKLDSFLQRRPHGDPGPFVFYAPTGCGASSCQTTRRCSRKRSSISRVRQTAAGPTVGNAHLLAGSRRSHGTAALNHKEGRLNSGFLDGIFLAQSLEMDPQLDLKHVLPYRSHLYNFDVSFPHCVEE